MNERETGEFIARQEAMAKQICKLEKVVVDLHKQQEELFRKMSSGRGFILGLSIASGTVGAGVASLFAKLTGGH